MSLVGNPRHGARKRIPPATRRRALELLAASREGATEAILLAQGFTVELLVELVRAGLATAKAERMQMLAKRARLASPGPRYPSLPVAGSHGPCQEKSCRFECSSALL
jgi:hypothetical protein